MSDNHQPSTSSAGNVTAVLIVLDSVGIGAAPDAAEFGDAGAATLPHLARAVGGLRLPTLQRLGLGNIPALLPDGIPILGVEPSDSPLASYGAMRERSRGKDTTTGHWEMAGLELPEGFRVFPAAYPSFPPELIGPFEKRTGRKILGNKAASGTAIIEELGARQLAEGAWIVYTSVDSVFQIAAHEEVIPLPELYHGCEIARELCNPHRIGRVIARPFLGKPGAFHRTENRRDFSFPLPEPTILDKLVQAGVTVTAVGKIEDIYAHRGISRSFHTGNNKESEAQLMALLQAGCDGLVFANLIDFDMLYGHRRDSPGYARCLEETDAFFGRLLPLLTREGRWPRSEDRGLTSDKDILIVTADHGNDPTFKGTDHTREYVPLLVYRPGKPGQALGIRNGFYDLAQSLAAFFGLPPMKRGVSFVTAHMDRQSPGQPAAFAKKLRRAKEMADIQRMVKQ